MTSPSVGIGAGATAGIKTGTPAGLYVVPVGSTETLRKGLAMLQFKATSPIMKKAFSTVFAMSRGWDKVLRPAVQTALKAKGITSIRLPSANFYANDAGVTKAPPLVTVPKGFKYYARKGYDPATGIAFIWVVVG